MPRRCVRPSSSIRKVWCGRLRPIRPYGRSVDELVRLLSALQKVDRDGIVTPEGWQPGEDEVACCCHRRTRRPTSRLTATIRCGFTRRAPTDEWGGAFARTNAHRWRDRGAGGGRLQCCGCMPRACASSGGC
ncbi:MAG: hypothetical protein U5M50_02325 [Sphingobium sp.]|nr:hypothetical protein [Sphingobium sp.]